MAEAGCISVNLQKLVSEELEHANIEKAIQHFQTALSYDDEHVLARSWLGRCYMIKGQLELARAELERTIKNGKGSGSQLWIACYQMGVLHLILHEYDKSRDFFASAAAYESFSSGLSRGFEVLPR